MIRTMFLAAVLAAMLGTRAFAAVSADEANTWGEPTLCMADKGYYVVNNDRVIQLSGGRLVAPAAWHRSVAGRQFNPRATAVCSPKASSFLSVSK